MRHHDAMKVDDELWMAGLLCGMALLCGCHGDSSQAPVVQAPHAKVAVPTKRGPTPAELTAGMIEAVTLGKSTVPVDVKFNLPDRPVIGQSAELVVAVMPQIDADLAVLTVVGSSSLVLAPGGGPIEMPTVDPTQVYRHNIQLTPTAEGVQLLELTVSLKHDDVVETRTFAIPLIVAPTAGALAAAKQ